MEEGSLRCDANVSVRPAGDDGARDEGGGEEPQLVPLPRRRRSSTKSTRQIDVLERRRHASCRRRGCGSGRAARRCRCAARKKRTTTATFPEPDLPPRAIDAASGSSRFAQSMPELPDARRRRVRRGIRACPSTTRRADAVTELSPTTSRRRPRRRATPKAASNWVMGEARAQAERARRSTSTRRR